MRKSKNLKQIEIAKLLDVTNSTYAHYEQGVREPDILTLKKLCIILDTDLNELLEFDTKEQRKSVELLLHKD
ncbi:MAG: helix-turn-helix transcriptional regulator [Clostridia bacterium]|nr:helix-turn-helix transcriptional regulator [Clostridia bacterium]